MSQAGEDLYRKEALDRLASPEQLDEMISISSSGAWAGLVGLLLLVGTLVAWAILGSVQTRIEGQGILFSGGGKVTDAVSLASGTLSSVGLEVGQVVRRGTLLAEIDQPDIMLKLTTARKRLAALSAAFDGLRTEQTSLAKARQGNADARRAALRDQVSAAEQRQSAYALRLENQQRLVTSGLAANASVQELREQLALASLDVASARADLVGIDAELLAADTQDQRDLRTSQQQVADAQAEVDQLALQLDQFGKVKSPADGVLVEWKASFGTPTGSGTPIASIASGTGQLQFMLYVSPSDGKRIAPGMMANVELDGFKKEQWGTLVGRIVSVSPFPSTPEGMRAVTQNDTLVARFAEGGAPFAVLVDLVTDSTSPSGYLWSGGTGAGTTLTAGTLGGAKVTIETRTPLSFVSAFFRQTSGT